MTQNRSSLYALSLLLCVLLAACGGNQEQTTATEPPPTTTIPDPTAGASSLTVGTINLGKAVGPDKKVTAPAESFAKTDTIYASVDTMGTGTATLKARWTYQQGGQTTVVNEETQTIAGPATTEFHISKPDGWPAGQYQVEVFIDDQSMGVKTFTVA